MKYLLLGTNLLLLLLLGGSELLRH